MDANVIAILALAADWFAQAVFVPAWDRLTASAAWLAEHPDLIVATAVGGFAIAYYDKLIAWVKPQP
ncbi:hypothetical protein [Lentzea sp. NPDC059081]|uniref:hypothetical protein n=1 Tax=Lentzea sp. NPDC059081 TaxID=3346719 RepID=UPI0036C2C4D5